MKSLLLSCIAICFLLMACEKDQNLDQSLGESFDHIVFGQFFGECLGDKCIRIYKLDSNGQLSQDVRKEYPSHDQSYRGDFVSLGSKEYEKVKDLIQHFPLQLFSENRTVLGCPDCADQGGTYIAYRSEDSDRFWLIDNEISALPAYLKDFVNRVSDAISQLED